ncbi:MAG: choice-of-anchor Q domain-containing protein, partial [Planctomycetota bacterium]|nr:choice-of-anchor Q domain-containing protein [Planctomycetota bacterium]
DTSAVLNGFTITGGNANGSWPRVSGAGMYNKSGSPTVEDCIFRDNEVGHYGGGMCNYDYSSPTVTGCDFIGNKTQNYGGGMLNYGYSHPTVSDCTFTDNWAADRGGGMCNFNHGNPTVTRCDFNNNIGVKIGGGMSNGSYSSPIVADCTFAGGKAWRGGGMNNDVYCDPTVTDCEFSNNIATAQSGGGMHNGGGEPVLDGCTFTENIATDSGGGMYNGGANPTLTNVMFRGNDAGRGGGISNSGASPALTNCAFVVNTAWGEGCSIHNQSNSSPTLVNCTFAGNSVDDAHSGLYAGSISNFSSSYPTLVNCILWDDTGNQIKNVYIQTTAVTYSDIRGGWPGTGNIDDDPLLDATAHLSPGSPCIDAGDDTAVTVGADLDGNPRISGAHVDMGAYESQGGPINTPPVANAGPDQIVECTGVTLDGSASSDDGQIQPLTYTWTWIGGSATGVNPAVTLPLGTTTVTLAVYDGELSDTDTVDITVGDTTAPVITINAPVPYGLYEAGYLALDFSASDLVNGDIESPALSATLTDAAGSSGPAVPGDEPGAGVFNLVVTAEDTAGNTAEETVFFVVYDPTGGFVTGGGWIWSPQGACAFDSTLEGKANFGFVSKYKKGANVPTGNTAFVFDVAEFEFHSSSYDWLVVTGSDYARFKGWGSINGEYGYRFMLWAGDGPDTFRIRIWTEDGDIETDVYDNKVDDTTDLSIQGGNIVIHTK